MWVGLSYKTVEIVFVERSVGTGSGGVRLNRSKKGVYDVIGRGVKGKRGERGIR